MITFLLPVLNKDSPLQIRPGETDWEIVATLTNVDLTGGSAKLRLFNAETDAAVTGFDQSAVTITQNNPAIVTYQCPASPSNPLNSAAEFYGYIAYTKSDGRNGSSGNFLLQVAAK